uniref:Uncharacterized protein n=1 Tax=Clastoptera arizonana TaxID=38151 RepID=A0A1B6C4U4_9HEMI
MLFSTCIFAFIIAGALGVGDGDFGGCKHVTYDNKFDLRKASPHIYVYAVPDLPAFQSVDGISIATQISSENDNLILAKAAYHLDSGKIEKLSYTNILASNGIVEEHFTDEIGNEVTVNMVLLGVVDECRALVVYRCSKDGTLQTDNVQILKIDYKTPMTDACNAQIDSIVKNSGLDIVKLRVLPYKQTNYS